MKSEVLTERKGERELTSDGPTNSLCAHTMMISEAEDSLKEKPKHKNSNLRPIHSTASVQ